MLDRNRPRQRLVDGESTFVFYRMIGMGLYFIKCFSTMPDRVGRLPDCAFRPVQGPIVTNCLHTIPAQLNMQKTYFSGNVSMRKPSDISCFSM
jgi:hypothetical protein